MLSVAGVLYGLGWAVWLVCLIRNLGKTESLTLISADSNTHGFHPSGGFRQELELAQGDFVDDGCLDVQEQ